MLENDDSEDFNFKFTNSLVYFDDPNGNFTSIEYDFSDTIFYENIIFNNDPQFKDAYNNKLNIPFGSPAEGAGINYGNLTKDITNSTRNSPPDLGAFNAIEFDD